MNALELKQKTTKELLNIAEEHGLKHVSRQKKADIIFNIHKERGPDEQKSIIKKLMFFTLQLSKK